MRCRDAASVSAPVESGFEVISDLSFYQRWWMLGVVLLDGDELVVGTRWRFESGRPNGQATSWATQVLEVESPRRIEMQYVEEDC